MAVIKLYKDTKGKFLYVLVLNEKILITSRAYSSKATCLRSVNYFKEHSNIESFYKRHTANCGSFYFTFHNKNNQQILSSISFPVAVDMEETITLIEHVVKTATIDSKVYSVYDVI